MPKKAKRVASRQAQLSQRGRRKGRHPTTGLRVQAPPEEGRPSPGPQQPQAPASAGPERPGVTPQAVAPAPPSVSTPVRTPRRPASRPAPSGSQQARAAQDVTPYVKRELARVSILLAVVVAVLVALTFVLR